MAILLTLFMMVVLFCLIMAVCGLPLWLTVNVFPVENKTFGWALRTSALASLAGLLPGLLWAPLSLITTFLVIRARYKLSALEGVIITLVQWSVAWVLILLVKMFLPVGLLPTTHKPVPPASQPGLRPVSPQEMFRTKPH